jgi:chitinase
LTRYYDSVAHAVYVHNTATGETWTYDDPGTIAEKADYVINNNLGGMMFWQLSDDTRDGVKNLLSAAVTVLNKSVGPIIPPPIIPPPIIPPPIIPPPIIPNPPTTPTSGLTIQLTNKNTTNFIITPGQTVTFNV